MRQLAIAMVPTCAGAQGTPALPPAGLPKLRRLVLAERMAVQQADGSWLPSPPSPAAFASLRRCRALIEVVYTVALTDAERSALRQALGERITLLQHD